jgi:hypothetical protein
VLLFYQLIKFEKVRNKFTSIFEAVLENNLIE